MTHTEGVGSSRRGGVSDKDQASQSKSWSLVEGTELILAGADWIWETDRDLKISWLSETYEAVTGVDPASVLGRFRFDFLRSGTSRSEHFARHLADLQARRPFRDFVCELKGAPAECRWISTTRFPRFDATGAFIGYRGIGRNVTAVLASLQVLEDAKTISARDNGPAHREIGQAFKGVAPGAGRQDRQRSLGGVGVFGRGVQRRG